MNMGGVRERLSTNFKLLAFRFILFCGKTDLKWGTKSSNNNTDAHNFGAIKTEIMRTCVCQRIRCVSTLASAWLPSPSPNDGWIHFYQRLMCAALPPLHRNCSSGKAYLRRKAPNEGSERSQSQPHNFILFYFFLSGWRLAFVISVIKTHSFLRTPSDTKMYAGQSKTDLTIWMLNARKCFTRTSLTATALALCMYLQYESE